MSLVEPRQSQTVETWIQNPMRMRELHPEVQSVLRNSSCGYVYSAVERLVRYVALVDMCRPEEVTIERLARSDVIATAREYHKSYSPLLGGLYRFLKDVGRPAPLILDKRKECHPILEAWINDMDCAQRRKDAHRYCCTQFLSWVCETQFPMYQSNELPVQFIVREYLVAYRRQLVLDGKRRRLKMATLKRLMQSVVAWVRWMCDEGELSEVETTGLAIRKSQSRERRLPSDSEISKFFAALYQKDAHYVVPFLIMLTTGARPIEVCKLTFNCLDDSKHQIWLQSKGGEGRWLPLPDTVWRALEEYLSSVRSVPYTSNSPIFINRMGRPLTYDTLAHNFYRINRSSGVDIDGMLGFRHRFATDCYESKMPPTVFQYMMGHKGFSETQRYQHVNTKFLFDEIRQAFDTERNCD